MMNIYLGNQAMLMVVKDPPPENSIGVFYSDLQKSWVWWYYAGGVLDAGEANSEQEGFSKGMLNFKNK